MINEKQTAVNAPIIQPFSFALPPDIKPPANKERKESAVISQLKDDSSIEVTVSKSEIAKLVRSITAKIATKPYKTPLPTCFVSSIFISSPPCGLIYDKPEPVFF